jgi:hypothetical protein
VRRRRLSYANVVASLALFVSLGGGAYAMSRLPAGSVGTKQLRRHAVTATKVARNTLTGAQIKESTLGQVPLSRRSEFASSAGFANNAGNAGNAGVASRALTADTATTAAKATIAASAASATTAANAAHAASATSATNATNATNASHASSATNATQLGGLAASGYLTSDHILSASVDPAAAAGQPLFTDAGTGAEVLDAGRGIVQITNTAGTGSLVLTGVFTSGSSVTTHSATVAPGASTQPSGTVAAKFLDLMITHVGASAARSTRLHLTCSLGTDPGTQVSALSCIGLG